MVKVLHVTHGYFPEDSGGIEAYLRMTIAAQRATGDEISVLAGSTEAREDCRIEPGECDGVQVSRLLRDDWYNDHYAHSYHPGASRLIREFFASERPDVVHVHQWIRLSSDIVEIAEDLGIPTVVTLHDVYSSCPRAFRVDREEQPCDRVLSVESCAGCVPRFGHETEREVATGIELFREQYRSELARADRVLVAAGVTADLLHRTTGVPRNRFTVQSLPYTARFAEVEAAPKETRTDGTVRFGYWGSLTPHKGPHVLIEAFARALQSAETPIELHLLGPLSTPELRTRIETLAEGLPVVLHGAFDAGQLLAADLDVAVFPVICFEGFGLGLAEAFELGIPSIVSDIGALADRVGSAGLRVAPGDTLALAQAMTSMADDPEGRKEMASHIPGLPLSPESHAAELRGHYRAVAAGHPPGPADAAPIVTSNQRAELILMQREGIARSLRDVRGRRDPS